MNQKIITITTAGLLAGMTILVPQASALTNYNASMNFNGSGQPSSLIVGQTYTLTATIHVNQQTPKPINSNGIWDVYGLSVYRINQSGGKTLNSTDDTSVTVEWLGGNRSKGNDIQQAYTPAGTIFPSGHTRWDDFQCGEQWLHQNETTAGKNVTLTCTFTPKTTGFYQIDVNSFYYYSTYTQSCYTGWCGPIGGYFIKVINPKPTPSNTPMPKPSCTPTVTPTPTGSPTPTVTSMPTGTPTPTSTPSSPIVINNNNNNVNSINITNNNTATATANTTVQPVQQTKNLPSTGTPVETYGLLSLIPFGLKLRKLTRSI